MSIQSVHVPAPSSGLVARPSPPENVNASADAQLAHAAAVTQQATSPVENTKASRQQLEQAVKVANDFVNSINDSVQFTVDGDTGKTVVKVIDTGTKEVIKQIPSEEMLAIAKALDKIQGLLVHQKA